MEIERLISNWIFKFTDGDSQLPDFPTGDMFWYIFRVTVGPAILNFWSQIYGVSGSMGQNISSAYGVGHF